MSAKVALFFTWRAFGAGTTTFTAHLAEGFRRLGIDPQIYRVKARSETFTRPFAQFTGLRYRNVSSEEALKIVKRTPSLLTAPCPAKHLDDPEIIHKLIKAGMLVTIHGMLDLRVHERLGTLELMKRKGFCVRPMLEEYCNAEFVPHPYVRAYKFPPPPEFSRPNLAVSIARMTFIKNTDIILGANELLPKDRQVVFMGTDDRLYIKHKIQSVFPNYKQVKTGFPPSWSRGAECCATAYFAVDMSDGKSNGGGGTQYTFLEAWDAGAVNLINSDWLQHKGIMRHNVNCYAVSGPAELARALTHRNRDLEEKIIVRGLRALNAHDPLTVAGQYWERLKR